MTAWHSAILEMATYTHFKSYSEINYGYKTTK